VQEWSPISELTTAAGWIAASPHGAMARTGPPADARFLKDAMTFWPLPLALADAINAFSSVILLSALPPHFSMHDVPTTYGLNVFILPNDTRRVAIIRNNALPRRRESRDAPVEAPTLRDGDFSSK
jgi:hypothetical protein